MTKTRKATLSPSRKQLVELMETIFFGRIECVGVRNGEPVLGSHRVKTEVKLAGSNDTRSDRFRGDYELKDEVLGLLMTLDAIGDGLIESIQVKHGLPFLVTVDGPVNSR